MRRACVDIGSNTTRLLVADAGAGTLRVLHEERAFTRIGVAVARGGGAIPEATRLAVCAVVAAQVRHARELGAETVSVVATAAIRDAANGAALLAGLRTQAGVTAVVLSAEREARLAFRGALAMREEPPPSPVGVLDVGGGSSEAVVGTADGEVLWWASLPIGSGGLAAELRHGDPPTSAQLDAARARARRAADAVTWAGPAPVTTVAVGGSATSLRRLAGERLDGAALERALELLCAGPAVEVAARHALDPVRVRLLPAGLVVLAELSRRLGGPLVAGRGGVREGVLLEALA